MQSRAKVFSLVALATLAIATPTRRSGQPASSCNTITACVDPADETIMKLLGIPILNPDILVGLTCNPVTVIGASGSS
ncbi:hypothetical protein MPER_00187, partial [Moniliophthora perniciosa FA553]